MYQLDNTRITKEFLLEKNTPETYMEYYLGVPVKKGLFCSPAIIRNDSKPTCSFYKNKRGDLIYKDFAGPSFDFVGAVKLIFDCSYYKALKIIANDFGYIKSSDPKNTPKLIPTGNVLKNTERANIQVEIKDFSEKELLWWNSFGISEKTLKKFKVFSIKHVFLNGVYSSSSSESSPIYGYYGGEDVNKNEYWRLYMPTKRSYRFLSNWSSIMIQGSKQLPKNSNFLVITKSLKDVMSLYEFGIPSIAPITENLFITQKQYDKLLLLYKNIYVLYDLDLPGIRAVKKIKKNFPNITILLMPRKYKCKDFTDFVKKYNTEKVFTLIDQAKHFYNQTT